MFNEIHLDQFGTQHSHQKIAEWVGSNTDRLLQQIKTLKPHMYQLSKNLLKTAPVSLYFFLNSYKKENKAHFFSSQTKMSLPKEHDIILEQDDEQHSMHLELPDRTQSFFDPMRLDTSQTDGEEIYTLNIFEKKSFIDFKQISNPILAFVIKGIDLLVKYNLPLLYELQQKFLQKNVSPILSGNYLQESQQISLFRQKPILPKRLLMDFIQKLENNSASQIIEKYSVSKQILQIWMITLLCDENQGKLPSGDDLFKRMSSLFGLSYSKFKKTHKILGGSSGFQITESQKGYRVQNI